MAIYTTYEFDIFTNITFFTGCNVNGRDILNGMCLPPGPQCEGRCTCEVSCKRTCKFYL